MYLCEPQAFDVFKDLFEPIICEYHKIDKVVHPKPDFGDLNNLEFEDLDHHDEFIISTRVRVGRNHKGYPFPPIITDEVKFTN